MWLFDRIRTIPDITRYWSSVSPDKVALIEGAASRTYAELNRRSNTLAGRMRNVGIRRGSRVGYLGKNSIAFFEVWFAASKIGCPIAPFNWRCAAEELLVLFDDASVSIVFVAEEFRDVVELLRPRAQAGFEIVSFSASGSDRDSLMDWAGDVRFDLQEDMPQRSDAALLTYTSGTTGRPKGVQAMQEAFQYSFLSSCLEPALSFSRDDIMLMAMPNFHLGGSWVSLAALYFGGAVSIIPSFDPQAVVDALRRDRPTLLSLVPTAIQILLNRSDFSVADYSSVRSILYFGSPIGRELLNSARKKLDCHLTQLYGASEAWILTALDNRQHSEGSDTRLGSCGRPLPLVTMKTVDPAGNELPNGNVGEVVVRTPMIFESYYNQREATRNVLKDGWYRTGDLGWRDSSTARRT
jgi:acyl-CoA synthetase (AMP-forming)/AMP-acid ligase II